LRKLWIRAQMIKETVEGFILIPISKFSRNVENMERGVIWRAENQVRAKVVLVDAVVGAMSEAKLASCLKRRLPQERE